MPYLLPNDEVTREQLNGYIIFLWAHDHPHPAHVHVRKGRSSSAWDLMTLQCVRRGNFSSSEIREQRTILKRHTAAIWRSWNAYWQNENR